RAAPCDRSLCHEGTRAWAADWHRRAIRRPSFGGFDRRDELVDLTRESTGVRPSGEVTAVHRRPCRCRRLSQNGVNVPPRTDAVMREGNAVHRLAASAKCGANVDVQNGARTTRKAACGYSSEGLGLRQPLRVVTRSRYPERDSSRDSP